MQQWCPKVLQGHCIMLGSVLIVRLLQQKKTQALANSGQVRCVASPDCCHALWASAHKFARFKGLACLNAAINIIFSDLLAICHYSIQSASQSFSKCNKEVVVFFTIYSNIQSKSLFCKKLNFHLLPTRDPNLHFSLFSLIELQFQAEWLFINPDITDICTMCVCWVCIHSVIAC